MKKWPGHILLLQLVLSATFHVTAQNEQANWYYGIQSGITFKTDPPTFLPGSYMNAFEGCTIANDKDGNVLFYSDGRSVINKNHEVMKNGLMLSGGNSSTMAALAVPLPGSTTIWYLFTLGDFGNTDGLCYNVIDLTRDGGSGEVIQKNSSVVNPVSEKLLAITHKNGEDIWIITKLHNKDVYHAYLLTSSGLETKPVVSAAGNSLTGRYSFLGYMASSPDGSLIAAVHGSAKLDLLCFDNTSGEISDLYGFNVAPFIDDLRLYGLAFSGTGEYLYLANADSDTNYLFQYRVGANRGETQASEVILARIAQSGSTGSFGALQRGPDNRIYLSVRNARFLGRIANPDASGSDCIFQVNGLPVNGPPDANCRYGLPSVYIPRITDSIVKITDSCYTMTIGFSIDSLGVTSIEWDFGDGTKSNSFSPTHEYLSPGEYTVTVTYQRHCQNRTRQIRVNPHLSPVDLGTDTTLCTGQQLTLSVFAPGFTYLWQDGSTGPDYTVSTGGVYHVVMRSGDCGYTDTIRVTYDDVTVEQFAVDTLFCVGQQYRVNRTGTKGSMTWHDGSMDMERNFTASGSYGFTYVEGCDTEYVALELEFEQCRCFLEIPSAFTPNDDHHNDVFRPVYDCWITSFHLEVYNRWGERIYVTHDPDAMWDGSYNGIRVPNGVYFYTVEYSTIARESDRKSGVLHVIR